MNRPSTSTRNLTQRLLRPSPQTQRRVSVGFKLIVPIALALIVGSHVVANLDAITHAVRIKALARIEERLGPVALGPAVSIGWLGTVHLGPMQILVPGERLPLLQVDAIQVRPSLLGLLQGRAEPGQVRLIGVTIRTDREGERVLDFARAREDARHDTGPTKHAHAASRELAIDFEKVLVVLDPRAAGDAAVTLGPFGGAVALESHEGVSELDADLHVPERGRVLLHGNVNNAKASFRRVSLMPLAPLVGGHGLELEDGELDGELEFHRQEEDHSAVAKIDLQVSKLQVEGARLATTPVGPAEGRLVGGLRADLTARRVVFEGIKLILGPTHVEVPIEASFELSDVPHFNIDARLGPVGLQALIGSVPLQLQPGAGMPAIDGPVRAEIRLGGPLRKLDAWNLDVRLDTTALKTASRDAPFPLREAFSYTPKEQVGAPRTLLIGERNPSFIPYAELPSVVPGSVMASEDGTFMTHNGFDFAEIQDAFATGEDGARMRGGSTLSQQLVKNLYLNRERTLARKIREAFITIEMEAAVPKTRVLELYLNIIEWGPGVYGIGEAARYYFGLDARYLDAKQAAFLATIIPNPKKFGPYYRHHPLTDQWQARIAKVLGLLRDRGVIDQAGYEEAIGEPLLFRGDGAR